MRKDEFCLEIHTCLPLECGYLEFCVLIFKKTEGSRDHDTTKSYIHKGQSLQWFIKSVFSLNNTF